MNRLSIGAAWEETLAFVKREGTLLFPVALLFLALPGVVLQLLLPDSMHQTEPMKEISATSQLPPQFLLGMGVVILMAMLGALALYALALRPGISVAEAIQLAFRRLPVLIGSALLLVAGFIGIAIVLSLIGGIVAGVIGIGPAMSALVLVTVPILLFFSVRLILLNAVVLHEPVNSVEAIRRSWRLSAGLFWKLRSEEHTSELQSLMRHSYAVFCLQKKKTAIHTQK